MKFLVIDDHPIVRDGLVSLLKRFGDDTVVIEARNSTEGFKLVEQQIDLDLVILDLALPGRPGLEVLGELRQRRPDLPVIIWSASEEPEDVRNALSLGALGYVPKSASQEVLLSAIDLVLKGDLYIPPIHLNQPIIKYALAGWRRESVAVLTARQIEVLTMISEGKPNKIIATELGLSEKTVKAHITTIFKALNVVNRTQAVTTARTAGII